MTTATASAATAPGATAASAKTTPKAAAMALMSFDKKMKHARELVDEGRRLLHAANRNLNVGTVLVRRSHQRLTDTEAYFSRRRASARTASH